MITAPWSSLVRRLLPVLCLVGGVSLFAATTWLAPASVEAGTPPVRPFNGLVTYVEDGPQLRVMAQRVDEEGLRGNPYELLALPAQPMNTRTRFGQFHASADGRVLSFFYTQLDTVALSRDNRLVVITLDASGHAATIDSRRLPEEFGFWETGDQIQVASQSAN